MEDGIDDIAFPENWFMRLVQCKLCSPTNEFKGDGFSYKILATIEEATYGRVYRCRQTGSADPVIIKHIRIDNERDGVPSSVVREVSLLRSLEHSNIIRVFTKETCINLVFEPLEYDFGTYIRENGGIQDPMIRKTFMRQILTGVSFIHAHKVLHRNLKPRNILMTDCRRRIKIADFGLAGEFGGDSSLTRHPANRCYRAPEVLLQSEQYSSGIDVWAVGCIFGEMVMGRPIFGRYDMPDELEVIFRMLGTPSEETWPGITEFPVFESYRKYNPKDLTIIFSGLEPEGIELLQMLLCLDPRGRISAENAMKHAYFDDLGFAGL